MMQNFKDVNDFVGQLCRQARADALISDIVL